MSQKQFWISWTKRGAMKRENNLKENLPQCSTHESVLQPVVLQNAGKAKFLPGHPGSLLLFGPHVLALLGNFTLYKWESICTREISVSQVSCRRHKEFQKNSWEGKTWEYFMVEQVTVNGSYKQIAAHWIYPIFFSQLISRFVQYRPFYVRKKTDSIMDNKMNNDSRVFFFIS